MELIDITYEDRDVIKKLTQNKKVVKYIDDGEIWNDSKINDFIKFNQEEQKKQRPHQYYYKIIVNSKFVGLIGIFLLTFFGGYYMNILLFPEHQRKGYFKKSLELLKKEIKKNDIRRDRINLLIREENERMLGISKKHYYYNRDRNIENRKYKEYSVFLRDYNYLYLSPEIDNDVVKKIFDTRGNWKLYNPNQERGNLDFLYSYLDFRFDKRLFSLKTLLKNIIVKKGINMIDKNLLFKELEKNKDAKKYLPSNYLINTDEINYTRIKKIFQTHPVLIFKPVHGYAGVGIEIFDNFEDFKKYTLSQKFKDSLKPIQKAVSKRNILASKYKEWVLQEYIDNPLLIDGKKFHIRGYYLVHREEKYLMDEGRIILAEEKYQQRDYKNKKIHDTHTHGEEKYVKYYPKDLNISQNKKDNIRKQMEHLFHLVGFVDKSFECYSESKDCYQLFGFDVMITDDYQVKLIEINSGPGVPNLHIPFGKKLFENQVKIMVDTIFPPKNKIRGEGGFIQVY